MTPPIKETEVIASHKKEHIVIQEEESIKSEDNVDLPLPVFETVEQVQKEMEMRQVTEIKVSDSEPERHLQKELDAEELMVEDQSEKEDEEADDVVEMQDDVDQKNGPDEEPFTEQK